MRARRDRRHRRLLDRRRRRRSPRRLGVTVIRPPQNTGSKAGAQTFALERVETGMVMALDADTTLAPGRDRDPARPPSTTPRCAPPAASCYPRHVKTMWERGRYVEYMLAFSFFKRVQDHYGKPLISSGCFSVYRTDGAARGGRLVDADDGRGHGPDLDLLRGRQQGPLPARGASPIPIEPHDFDFMGKQLRRWSHGFVQNVRLHWRGAARARLPALDRRGRLLGRAARLARLSGPDPGPRDRDRPADPRRPT